MGVAKNHSPYGVKKSESAQRVDLKVLLMMDIAGESMDKKILLELNIQEVTTDVHIVTCKTVKQQNIYKGQMMILMYLRSHAKATILVNKLLLLYYNQHSL